MEINTTNTLATSTPTTQALNPNTENNSNTLSQLNTPPATADTITLSSASINLSNASRTTETDTDTSNIDPQQVLNNLQNSIEENPEQAIAGQSNQITSQVVQGLLG